MALADIPERLLMGPGPSMVHQRVLDALGKPLVGHLDPAFLSLLDEVQAALRRLFGTDNEMTLPVSGTGSAGMELCLHNLVEEGDEVVVGVNGVFGTRMAELAGRLGAEVHRVEADWGDVIDPAKVAGALAACRSPALVAIVHAETSTGAWQPVEEISGLAHDSGALLLLDTVTSLAGCPVQVDRWGVDASYSGTQKCLSCPPGLSPVTLSPRAMEKVASRRTPLGTWYFDLGLIGAYLGGERVYHHTAPISMIFGLAEALALVEEEGLEARFDRHCTNHELFIEGARALGLEPLVEEGKRLWMLNSVRVPEGIDETGFRQGLLARHGIEIGPGLGPLAGGVWRVGLMGESSRRSNVERFLSAAAEELGRSY